MKEILIPYVLLVWLLVKLRIISWNLKTGFWSVSIGFLIGMSLLVTSRHFSPADLTNSATVKAPRAVLSPLFSTGEFHQIQTIYVTHNQKVKKGDLLYTLVNWESEGKVESLNHQIIENKALFESEKKQEEKHKLILSHLNKDLYRLQKLGEFTSQESIEKLQKEINITLADIVSTSERAASIKAKMKRLYTEKRIQEKKVLEKNIISPIDGQVSVINISSGSRVGNMHIYDTGNKFLEVRVPEQSIRNIAPGNFAEFYLDAYPGNIFRGVVHSVTSGTGESQLSISQGEAYVSDHIENNSTRHGRTVIIKFDEPNGFSLPIGSTGSAWISAKKPNKALGFIDMIGAGAVRIKSMQSYVFSM